MRLLFSSNTWGNIKRKATVTYYIKLLLTLLEIKIILNIIKRVFIASFIKNIYVL